MVIIVGQRRVKRQRSTSATIMAWIVGPRWAAASATLLELVLSPCLEHSHSDNDGWGSTPPPPLKVSMKSAVDDVVVCAIRSGIQSPGRYECDATIIGRRNPWNGVSGVRPAGSIQPVTRSDADLVQAHTGVLRDMPRAAPSG
jgi:hypothetical protein